MKKLVEKVKQFVPVYCWLPLLFGFLLNTLVYSGAKLIAGGWYHYNIETAWDLAIPLVPEMIIIYFGCYLFWGFNYILIARLDEERAYRFCCAENIAKLICFVFYLVWPTTNTRPELTGSGIWNCLMQFLYWIDAPDNLFPSIHCLCSWFCYIGMRRDHRIPRWYRVFSCLFAVAVFLSTLTTKQHVIADVISGVLLAEVCYWWVAHTRLPQYYGKLFQSLTKKIFG